MKLKISNQPLNFDNKINHIAIRIELLNKYHKFVISKFK